MSEDMTKLQRLLEQATAAAGASDDDLDPDAGSLREAWLGLGRLLEAAQPESNNVPFQAPTEDWSGEGQEVRAVPRRAPLRRRLLSAAALVAASLLIGFLATWLPRATDRSESVPSARPQTAAINAPRATLVPQKQPTTAVQPQWDDAPLDEQIAQVGQRVIYAQQDAYAGSEAYEPLRYGIEQMQKDLEGNGL